MVTYAEIELLEIHIVGLYIIIQRLHTMNPIGIIKGKYAMCMIPICDACLFWKSIQEGLADTTLQ